MDDVCQFCGADHFAHTRLVCGARLDAAIKRGKSLFELYQQMRAEALKAIDIAEQAIERAERAEALAEQADVLMASVGGLCTVLMAKWPNLRTTLHAEAIVGTYFMPAEALAQTGEGA